MFLFLRFGPNTKIETEFGCGGKKRKIGREKRKLRRKRNEGEEKKMGEQGKYKWKGKEFRGGIVKWVKAIRKEAT